MKINRIDNIGVAVSNVGAALDFFSNVLGLETATDDWGGGSVQIGNAWLYVFEGDSNAPRSAVRGVDLPANAVGIDHIALEVDDIEQAGRELEGKGVVFPGEITGEPGEFRYRGFQGPDGIMLYIIQQPTA